MTFDVPVVINFGVMGVRRDVINFAYSLVTVSSRILVLLWSIFFYHIGTASHA